MVLSESFSPFYDHFEIPLYMVQLLNWPLSNYREGIRPEQDLPTRAMKALKRQTLRTVLLKVGLAGKHCAWQQEDTLQSGQTGKCTLGERKGSGVRPPELESLCCGTPSSWSHCEAM